MLPYAIIPNGNGKTEAGTPNGNNYSGSPLGPSLRSNLVIGKRWFYLKLIDLMKVLKIYTYQFHQKLNHFLIFVIFLYLILVKNK